MQPFARDLVEALEEGHDTLMSATETIIAAAPSMGADRYSDEELKQLTNGFAALLKEALEERGSETYELFIETAVPGVVADGVPPEALIETSAAFGTLLSLELCAAVRSEHRAAAGAWLAHFFGRYVGDVYRAASDASAAR